MKFFKKALLATAVVGAFGVQAADVSDATKFTSAEGFAVNGVSVNSAVRVIVRQKLEAGDKIHLQFGAGLATTGAGFAVAVGQAATPATSDDLAIDTGTATFDLEFLAADSDLAKGLVVLEVKTGYTIELDESFEVIAGPDMFKSTATSANSTVTYSAYRWQDGVAKDTTGDNTGAFIKLASQYGVTVSSLLNGVIERENAKTFISGSSASNVQDTFVLTITDRQDYLGALNGANVDAEFVVTADFSDITDGEVTATAATGSLLVGDLAADVSADEKTLTLNITDAAANGIAGTITIDIDNTTRVLTETIKATKFVVDAEVDFDGAGTIKPTSVLTKASAGEWKLDATIINIPYFPVGYAGLSTSVHFANENSSAVDVNITAIDDKGTVYSGELADLAKQTVTKVSQTTLQAALKDSKGNTVPNGTKLSVTFNIDADEDTVNAYAMSNEVGVARQQLANSQQKGIK